jgi:beta-1,4-mannosyl-glycoprotein beta-1,4-N-acetylglucosaminyltransferase
MRKLFSLTPFFNELDVLEIRLATLDPIVDVHVIVEMPITHSGKPKPLYFPQNTKRFSPWLEKIYYIPVSIDKIPTGTGEAADWERENFHRNYCARAFEDIYFEGDYILLSDLDEIPSPRAIKAAFEANLTEFHLPLPMHLYYLDWRWPEAPTPNFSISRIFPAVRMKDSTLETLRHEPMTVVPGDGLGWHFAYMGGAEAIKTKLESFAHGELDKPDYKDEKHLRRVLDEGIDIFHRDHTITKVPVATLPKYVQQNRERFHHLLSESRSCESSSPAHQASSAHT